MDIWSKTSTPLKSSWNHFWTVFVTKFDSFRLVQVSVSVSASVSKKTGIRLIWMMPHLWGRPCCWRFFLPSWFHRRNLILERWWRKKYSSWSWVSFLSIIRDICWRKLATAGGIRKRGLVSITRAPVEVSAEEMNRWHNFVEIWHRIGNFTSSRRTDSSKLWLRGS